MKIYVITHKEFEMPELDGVYIPLWVGAAGKTTPDRYLRDDTGDDQISKKNSHYCELTGQYWISKNDEAEDYVGLCHYRRYFVTPMGKASNILTHKAGFFLTGKQIRKILSHYDLIRHNVTILKQKVGESFESAHGLDLNLVRNIIKERYPDYLSAYDAVINGRQIHLLNMFITSKEHFNAYSAWLFDVLFALEEEIGLTDENKRIMGFLSERLLDVWVKKNHLRAKECLAINTERIDMKILTK